MIRVAPGTAGTIDSIELIEMCERSDASHKARLFESELCRLENRF